MSTLGLFVVPSSVVMVQGCFYLDHIDGTGKCICGYLYTVVWILMQIGGTNDMQISPSCLHECLTHQLLVACSHFVAAGGLWPPVAAAKSNIPEVRTHDIQDISAS